MGESYSRFKDAPVNGSAEILDFLHRDEDFISVGTKVLKNYEKFDGRYILSLPVFLILM